MNEPSLSNLRVFYHVAQHGSFSEAARVLHISQSALSRTIKLLEEMLDARLFDRTSRRVTLTAAGAALLPVAERLASEFENAFKDWSERLNDRPDCLTISLEPAASPEIFAAISRRFRDSCPNTKVVILDEVSHLLRKQLLDGDVDLAITADPGRGSGISFEPIFEEEFGVVCCKELARSLAAPVAWSVFEDRAVVVMRPGSGLRCVADEAFAKAGIEHRIIYECSQLATVGALVAAGAAVSLLPASAVAMLNTDALEWRAMERPDVSWCLGLARPDGAEPSPTVQAFIGAVTSARAEGNAVLGVARESLAGTMLPLHRSTEKFY